MALHTQLPIHKLAYDLLGLSVELVRNMPRDIKASLGSVIRDECVQMLVLIARANASADKVPHISSLLEAQQTVELLLRTCHDKRFISHGQWASAIELMNRIGQQAGGWRKQSARQAAARPQLDSEPGLFSAAVPAA
ncbi:four helix bundle protein [Methylibium sp.]|uniref:four helix bundle protein n=1 Tax=Methylibium sp. TaxID=2067992 RepID=UPI003BA99FFB